MPHIERHYLEAPLTDTPPPCSV